jgi:hypothetical protein
MHSILGYRNLLSLLIGSIILTFSSVQASTFDYRHYESILNRYSKPDVLIEGIQVAAVDYAALAGDAKKEESDYSKLLRELVSFDPETFDTREDKIAFWINVYNIGAIKTIVDHYPVDSIRSRKIHWLGLPWNRKVIMVGGKEHSLAQIEHDILLDTFKELRIHFAINCASVSCVNLAQEPYRGSTLLKQMEEQGRQFLADQQKGVRIDREKRTIYLSQVFKFDKNHFDELAGGAINFILPYLRSEDREFVKKENVTIEYLDYNWKSNYIKNVR